MTIRDLYVGTYTVAGPAWGTPSEGIEHLAFDDETGGLQHLDTITGLQSPQYLAPHPTAPVLYATESAAAGALTAFVVRPDDTLQKVSTAESLGGLPVAVSVHPTGRYAYVANWHGTVTQFPLADDGTLGTPEPIPQGGRDRCAPPHDHEGSHPHQIRPTPSGHGVLVAYRGRNELVAYTADPEGRLSSLPVATIEFPPSSGPRHLEYHPSGRWIYVVGERDSMLYVIEADEGMPIRIARALPTIPHADAKNRTSELVVHPDGRALYVGNRGADCVTVFAIGDSGAAVDVLGHEPTIGQAPWALTIDPTGRYLLVGNALADETRVFAIEDDRTLTTTGVSVKTNSPSSLLFV
jgi:6-phosphogluconolactonase